MTDRERQGIFIECMAQHVRLGKKPFLDNVHFILIGRENIRVATSRRVETSCVDPENPFMKGIINTPVKSSI